MEERLKKLQTRIAVRAIIVNNERKVILIRRAMGTFEGGRWCLVGGKLDENEGLDMAISRETQEEVGEQFPLTYYREVENPDISTGVKWITHYFVGKSNNLPTHLDTREVSEAAFFSESEIETLDIAFDHKTVLSQFFKKK